jgi:hypothetical protein
VFTNQLEVQNCALHIHSNETNGSISTANQAVEFSLELTCGLEFTTALHMNLMLSAGLCILPQDLTASR